MVFRGIELRVFDSNESYALDEVLVSRNSGRLQHANGYLNPLWRIAVTMFTLYRLFHFP